VGLPLAVEFGKRRRVIGFDVNPRRVVELRRGVDASREVSSTELKRADIYFTHQPEDIGGANFIILCVPTPIDRHKDPDLRHVRSAAETVGRHMRRGSIVVLESTVYPGVTEEICAPILERESGMKCGRDFYIGYSPERINPGDKEHTVSRIVKVVAAQDQSTLNTMARVYGSIVKAGVYKAPSIKTAEAAKVIENIQRDLNIALMNELSLIFERMGLNTREVIETAGTKWNFHKYYPGLVGGHCIGVDPYYLTYKAIELGHHPEVILAGRYINDNMYKHVVGMVVRGLATAGKPLKGARVLIMGLTFKENVSDVRNSKVTEVIRGLREYGMRITGYDPLVAQEDQADFQVPFARRFEDVPNHFDCVIVFSPHSVFRKIALQRLKKKMSGRPLLVDIKSFYREDEARKMGMIYRSL
jgi:UDP-N-acetyl-D-galactosamine dehydrogenase